MRVHLELEVPFVSPSRDLVERNIARHNQCRCVDLRVSPGNASALQRWVTAEFESYMLMSDLPEHGAIHVPRSRLVNQRAMKTSTLGQMDGLYISFVVHQYCARQEGNLRRASRTRLHSHPTQSDLQAQIELVPFTLNLTTGVGLLASYIRQRDNATASFHIRFDLRGLNQWGRSTSRYAERRRH